MMAKKQQKKLTYAEIIEKIDSLQFTDKSKSKDFITLTNTFCKLKDVKGLKEDEIESLIEKCLEKTNRDYWKFLLEVFSRFFYKSSVAKNKTEDKVLFAICGVIIRRFGIDLDRNLLNQTIIENNKAQFVKSYILNLQQSTGLEQNEFIALAFILFILTANRILMQDRESGIRNIEKYIFELYGTPDKNDKFYIKSITKSLEEDKVGVLFYSFVGMYEGATSQISNLEDEKMRLQQVIGDKNQEITSLNSSVGQLNNQIKMLNEQLQINDSTIASLQKDLEAGSNRNEYNENLYKKQYESLKKGFIEKLKKDLKLEIQGLEDLADLLPDSSKIKIQRRIDNIYKILQKAGE